jgi:F-type H+-transporting ATPase subunit O
VKTSSLEPTAKAIASLGNLVEKDAKLATILEAPTLTPADRSAIVAELQKASGASGETVNNFLSTLAENNRLALLPDITAKFNELIRAARGEVEVTVTSAQVCAYQGRIWRRRDTAIFYPGSAPRFLPA